MGTEEVIDANERFYAAFGSGDVAAMEELWAETHDVGVIHPGWPPLHGRDTVLGSWRRILEGPGRPQIACTRARVIQLGETAVVVCYEQLDDGDLIATNVFHREGGRWKLVHHQAGPVPPLADADPDETVH